MDSSEIPGVVVAMRSRILDLARRNRRMDPEELYHRVAFSCWRQCEKLSAVGCPQAWVIKIANREIVNCWRRDRHYVSLPEGFDAVARPNGSGVQDPFEESARHEAAHLLREQISRLPLIYREVLTAVSLGGQSLADFANSRGYPLDTCKTRYRRALDLLRRDPRLCALWNPTKNPKGTTP